MKKTFIFDFDGTLVDSMSAFSSVSRGILDQNGIAYGDDLIKIITPLGYAGVAKYFVGLGLKGTADEIVEIIKDRLFAEYEARIPEKKGTGDTLRELKRRGASLSVLTAAPHKLLDVCLKRLDLFDLFDNVWSCDDFGMSKTDPDIYRLVASKLGVEVSDAVFVDDNVNAVRTAKQAGMVVCGIYDESSAELKEEMQANCDKYLLSLSDLID